MPVMAIVLHVANFLGLDILRVLNARLFMGGYNAVGLGSCFHIGNVLLAVLKFGGFAGCQFAGRDTLLNAGLLPCLTLINTGNRLGKCGQCQKHGDGCDDNGYSHNASLLMV